MSKQVLGAGTPLAMDHIFALHTLIDLYLNKKKRLYCALIDYIKPFDCVDRTLLWQRILESNVNGKLFRVIYNMYDAAKSSIKVGPFVGSIPL